MAKNKRKIKLGFFGDSICVGQGVSLYKGWVINVAKATEELARNFSVSLEVFNSSVNGRTTRQALEDMPYAIQSQSVDVLWIQFGLNDCNHWESDFGLPRVSVGAYRENLLEMVARARNSGVRRIVVANNHPTDLSKPTASITSQDFEANNKRYCDAALAVGSGGNDDLVCFDVHKKFCDLVDESEFSLREYLDSDGLHLSEKGHQLYFYIAWPIIKDILADLANLDAESN